MRVGLWIALLAIVELLAVSCSRLPAEEAAPVPLPRPAQLVAAEAIYDGKLGAGWQDWGWGPHELGRGAARLNMNNFGGWILYRQGLSGRTSAVAAAHSARSAVQLPGLGAC